VDGLQNGFENVPKPGMKISTATEVFDGATLSTRPEIFADTEPKVGAELIWTLGMLDPGTV
jgi:hypothetical protein